MGKCGYPEWSEPRLVFSNAVSRLAFNLSRMEPSFPERSEATGKSIHSVRCDNHEPILRDARHEVFVGTVAHVQSTTPFHRHQRVKQRAKVLVCPFPIRLGL